MAYRSTVAHIPAPEIEGNQGGIVACMKIYSKRGLGGT